MKRSLSLILITLILFTAAACGSEPKPPDDTETETVPDETTAEELTLTVPKSDFGGHVVKYLTGTAYCNNFKLNISEENGDTLNDAGYKRERAVSDLLNVEFDAYEVDVGNIASTLNASVMAGAAEYDFVLPHANIGHAAMVSAGSLLDWNKLDEGTVVELADAGKPEHRRQTLSTSSSSVKKAPISRHITQQLKRP